MFRFAEGSTLWWSLIILVLVVVFVWRSQANYRLLRKTFGDKMLPFFLSRFSFAKRNWKMILSCFALFFMILALARPQLGKGKTQITSQGVELMMVVDVSRSMLSEDVKPSRLDHAKKEMSRLLDLLGGDKVGLIAFAGSAVILSPMTNDKSALRMFLESLSPETVETQGTEIGKALNEAQMAFERGGEEVGPNQRMTRVVVLISDGEDHEDGAIKLAQDMAEKGTRVFAMAFGSERGGRIPKRDGRGLLQGFIKDKSGQEVVSRVNEDLMKQIARAGGGSFYHVTFDGSQMKRLREDIDKLEKTEFDTMSTENFDERFQIPLFLAFFFAFIELFIGTRRRTSTEWKGRFVQNLIFLGFALQLLSPSAQAGVSLSDTWKNNKALELLENKKNLEAFELYSDLAVRNAQEPLMLFNLATSFMTVEQLEKAKIVYSQIVQNEQMVDPTLAFSSHYNLAQIYSTKGMMDIDKALGHYQKALSYQPESVEIKTNIELLIQSSSGGGGGGSDQNENQDKKDESEEEQPQEPKEFTNKQQPQKFQSKDISKHDVQQILEELKNQEQKIRAKYERKGRKEEEREKSW